MSLILALTLNAHAAEKGRLLRWCERHMIVGEDPWPYAEYATDHLIWLSLRKRDSQITKELVYRFRRGLLTEEQHREVSELIGMGEK